MWNVQRIAKIADPKIDQKLSQKSHDQREKVYYLNLPRYNLRTIEKNAIDVRMLF